MASQFGVIGLGVMGSAYVRNLASRGIRVSGFSIQNSEIEKLKNYGLENLRLHSSLEEFVNSLESPRKILLLVTAGKAVDTVLHSLEPLLAQGDIVIDGGNEWYKNTARRILHYREKNIHFCSMGVSGGEEGALVSPCLMFSGPLSDYDKVKSVIEQHPGRSYYIGPAESGHYVKMVHNGIEYAIMQILSEIYMILRNVMDLNLHTIGKILAEWNNTEVQSFLLGITAKIMKEKDGSSATHLLDKIVDSSGANGTGKWTVIEALELGVPVPTITVAVEMRNASNGARDTELLPNKKNDEGTSLCEGDLKRTLLGCMLVVFAQGTALLTKASHRFQWQLNLSNICKIWSKDSIISCDILNKISEAFATDEPIVNLLNYPTIKELIKESISSWRKVCKTCLTYNVPTPGIIASLQYIQTMSSIHLGHNLIQAQRDYFGSHCFTRVDAPGKHHHNWRR